MRSEKTTAPSPPSLSMTAVIMAKWIRRLSRDLFFSMTISLMGKSLLGVVLGTTIFEYPEAVVVMVSFKVAVTSHRSWRPVSSAANAGLGHGRALNPPSAIRQRMAARTKRFILMGSPSYEFRRMPFRISTATCLACSPLSFVGPTQDGQPERQGQARIVSRQCSRSFSSRLNSPGLSPIPPG